MFKSKPKSISSQKFLQKERSLIENKLAPELIKILDDKNELTLTEQRIIWKDVNRIIDEIIDNFSVNELTYFEKQSEIMLNNLNSIKLEIFQNLKKLDSEELNKKGIDYENKLQEFWKMKLKIQNLLLYGDWFNKKLGDRLINLIEKKYIEWAFSSLKNYNLEKLYDFDVSIKKENLFPQVERKYKKHLFDWGKNWVKLLQKNLLLKKIFDDMNILLEKENVVKYQDFLLIYLPSENMTILINDDNLSLRDRNSIFIVLWDFRKQNYNDFAWIRIDMKLSKKASDNIRKYLKNKIDKSNDFHQIKYQCWEFKISEKKLVGRYISDKQELIYIIKLNLNKNDFNLDSYSQLAMKHNDNPANKYKKMKLWLSWLLIILWLDPRNQHIDIIKKAIYWNLEEVKKLENSTNRKNYLNDTKIKRKMELLYDLYKEWKFWEENLGSINFEKWKKKSWNKIKFCAQTFSSHMWWIRQTKKSYQILLWKRFVNYMEWKNEDKENEIKIKEIEEGFFSIIHSPKVNEFES